MQKNTYVAVIGTQYDKDWSEQLHKQGCKDLGKYQAMDKYEVEAWSVEDAKKDIVLGYVEERFGEYTNNLLGLVTEWDRQVVIAPCADPKPY